MSAETTSMARVAANDPTEPAGEVLRTREQAEAYVASVCFKHGPPSLVGVELEWLLGRPPESAPLDVEALVAALGPHTPRTLDPQSPALPLPSGSLVTVEPGGQVELASPPLPDLEALFAAVESDTAALHTRLRAHGLQPIPLAADPTGAPRRLLNVPRYSAMEAAFDRIGPHGRSMMCSTAAVQPCFDLGERDDLWKRWTVLHAVGPVLLAAFANSPVLHGRTTGWKSSRMACWWALDPPRTAPPDLSIADPAAGYARRAMEAGLLCLRRGDASWDAPAGVTFADWLAGALTDKPTTADLDLHLSTLFPPVRPQGHLEVRYLDAQPGTEWVVPVAVLAAVLSTPRTIAGVLQACLPIADRWLAAAHVGLADQELARAGVTVFTLVLEALPSVIGSGPVRDLVERVLQERALRGRCPADGDESEEVR
ncbi:MAG: ergothioneine biosynthesis glutamate--cysteine ligase EgtA [Actinomycetota bacterium]|nr:ergothioneine biosynthesis glutamate--cysteine ligase EgtA [Actinomycetota bacterium]